MPQQLVGTSSLGGYYSFGKLSQKMRQQNMAMEVWRQFARVEPAFGKNVGQTHYWDKTLNIDTRGSTIAEDGTTPRNLIKTIQGSATIARYGNSVSYTGLLKTVSEFDVEKIYTEKLRKDQIDTFENAVKTVFCTAKFKAVCSAAGTTVFTTNGTATATATVNMSKTNFKDVVDYMRRKQIPYYMEGQGGDRYVSIHAVGNIRAIYDDLESLNAYTKPTGDLNREIGGYYKTRILEDNGWLSEVIGAGSDQSESVFFGNEAVLELVALPETIEYEETDLKNDRRVGYNFYGTWAVEWNLATDDLNSTGKGIERIVHVTSA